MINFNEFEGTTRESQSKLYTYHKHYISYVDLFKTPFIYLVVAF